MKEKIIWFLSLIGISVIFYTTLSLGIVKQQKHECLVWEKQSKEYPSFYALDWQVEQCKTHNIKLLAN